MDLSLAIESRGLTKIRRGDDPFTAERKAGDSAEWRAGEPCLRQHYLKFKL
jgi:hypothetical protein